MERKVCTIFSFNVVMIKLLSILILSIFLISSSFTPRVVRVIDGDTIVVLTEKQEQIKIRLEGISMGFQTKNKG